MCADMNGVIIGDQQLVEVCVKVVLVIALTRTLCGVVLDAIDLRMTKDDYLSFSPSYSDSCLVTPPRVKVAHHPFLKPCLTATFGRRRRQNNFGVLFTIHI